LTREYGIIYNGNVADNIGDKIMETTSKITKSKVVQEMLCDNDTLLITDPCYLLTSEDWDILCDNAGGMDNMSTAFTDYFREHFGFGEVIVANTGIGDWANSVRNTDSNEQLGTFGADSGTVIVCTASDFANYGKTYKNLEHLNEMGLVTVLPGYTGYVRLTYETTFDDTNYKYDIAVLQGYADKTINGYEDFNWSTLHLEEF
jgi:hypothetical protein